MAGGHRPPQVSSGHDRQRVTPRRIVPVSWRTAARWATALALVLAAVADIVVFLRVEWVNATAAQERPTS